MGRKGKGFFENMYEQIEIGDTGSPHAIKNKLRICKIMMAINDVSRESHFGVIREEMMQGTDKGYDEEHLDLAYKLFKEIIKIDLETGVVKVNILKLARDPDSALKNVVERVATVDMMTMDDKEASKEINDQVFDVIEGSAREEVDGQTLKLVALHKAMHYKDDELYAQITRNKYAEEQLTEFIYEGKQGMEGDPVKRVEAFPERVENKPNKDPYFEKTKQAIEAIHEKETEEDISEAWSMNSRAESYVDEFDRNKWDKRDGLTNSIMSNASEKDGEFQMAGSGLGNARRFNLIDLVDNIEDISSAAENMKITRN